MKLILGLFLSIFIIFLISCSKENTTTSLVVAPIQENFVKNISIEETTIEDLCIKINCSTNRTCDNGNCICKQGTKECNGSCISTEDCCNDNDCKDQHSCINKKCVRIQKCDYLQTWNRITSNCICNTGTKFCPNQKKCIPIKNCCNDDNCNLLGGDDNLCTETKFLVNICISNKGNGACRFINIDKQDSITLLNRNFDIILNKIYNDDEIMLIVKENKNEYLIDELKVGKEITLSSAKIKYTNISTYGGKCVSSE